MTRQNRLVGLLTGAAITAVGEVAHACPVCFRVDDDAAAAGVYSAVFVLFGVTASVLGGVAIFIARFIRRAGRHGQGEAGIGR